MANRGRQEEERVDTPQRAVGRVIGDPRQEQIYTSEDGEYQRYSELLKGFLVKIVRWQEILAARRDSQYEQAFRLSYYPLPAFSVFRSPSGEYFIPSESMWKGLDLADRVLNVHSMETVRDVRKILTIMPGPAGRHLIIDPENHKTLESVDIEVYSNAIRNISEYKENLGELRIYSRREGEGSGLNHIQRQVSYKLVGDTLTVNNLYPHPAYEIMTDEMALSLVNTIDRLIPNATNPISQNGRKATHERRIPRLLRLMSAPGRRPAGK